MNLETHHTSFTKVNSKLIRNVNGKCKTTESLKGNIGENLHDIKFGDNFQI